VPYVEGTSLDEPCTRWRYCAWACMANRYPPQDGAPVRVVVPWKYGFKSIKSLVKHQASGQQSPSTWNITNSHEYGFYSNVKPSS